MNGIEEFIRAVVRMQLFAETWTSVVLLVATFTTCFTLLHHLADCLKGPIAPALYTNRLSTRGAFKTNKHLIMFLSGYSGATLLLTLVRCAFGCSTPSDAHPCLDLSFAITIMGVGSVIFLLIGGIYVESCAFDHRRIESEIASRTPDAAIYLKSGRKLRGYIPDLNFLRGKRHFPFLDESGQVTILDIRTVDALFLQGNYSRNESVTEGNFIEGPRSLQLRIPHQEQFPRARYFRRHGLVVVRVDKPTSHTRIAVLDEKCLNTNLPGR